MAADKKTDRLAKVMAQRGVASRRGAERLIEEGRVRVNGSIVYHPGHAVHVEVDLIKVDGRPLPDAPRKAYFLLNKPRGYLTGRADPDGRKSVHELVQHLPVRVEPVGRLDIDTEGALIFTNDGELAHLLTHPSSLVPKRYVAKVWRTPTEKTLNRIRAGLRLEDGRAAPCKARVKESTESGNAWVEITVTEGRNRLIRRVFEAVNHPVSKLRRESVATISVRGLERGQVRQLSREEVSRLKEISQGGDPQKAGHGDKLKKGYAKPKPRPNKPLSKKKKKKTLQGRRRTRS